MKGYGLTIPSCRYLKGVDHYITATSATRVIAWYPRTYRVTQCYVDTDSLPHWITLNTSLRKILMSVVRVEREKDRPIFKRKDQAPQKS